MVNCLYPAVCCLCCMYYSFYGLNNCMFMGLLNLCTTKIVTFGITFYYM